MTVRYRAYAEYKDSGLEWLGHIPSHWEIKRLGQFFEERREKVSDKVYPPLSVTMKGIVPQLETAAKTDAGDNRKLVLKNDFVINSRSDRKGSSGVSYLDGSVSLISIVMTPKKIEPAYVHHLLRSYNFQEEFYRHGKGIVADLWSTNSSEMKNIFLPELSPEEQVQIANFLDYETAKIDKLIEKQQQLIKLLEEKRQAVISHAVTKGLNPNAPMKNSGIEWLGEVPAHWETPQMKFLVSKPIIDGPHESPVKRDQGIPFISAESIKNFKINFDNMWGYISEEDNDKYSRRFMPQKNDIFVVKLGATTGSVALLEEDLKFNIWVPLAAIRMNKRILPKFAFYFLRSDQINDAFKISWTYGTQQTLGLKTIGSLHCPIPSKSEQERIVAYLDRRIPLFEKAGQKANEQINLLQERRAALISAAVTGKIDVRDWVCPQKAE